MILYGCESDTGADEFMRIHMEKYDRSDGIINGKPIGRSEYERMIRLIIREQKGTVFYGNETYTVQVDELTPPFLHISVHRRDRGPIRDWRDMQEIKNLFVGPEAEAVELYPAESRLLDAANEYHLWALRPPRKFNVGYHDGRNVGRNSDCAGRAKQRDIQDFPSMVIEVAMRTHRQRQETNHEPNPDTGGGQARLPSDSMTPDNESRRRHPHGAGCGPSETRGEQS